MIFLILFYKENIGERESGLEIFGPPNYKSLLYSGIPSTKYNTESHGDALGRLC
jgi:hypothetical protein